ncbi:uncharacterized protein LOC112018681 [Quercus suber]|uniref:uncharacterized protein LOC112018681 n=1 Tax=Quercus suber TaxID=58331 RepID=UPI000CE27531|nr:uncharacterized protein LOC112018681 [Quercus suber]
MREYYAFRLQKRDGEGHTLISGGRLFQQFDVDAYTCIEAIRLMWVKNNQEKLRIDLNNGLKDAVMRGDTTPASAGKRFVLPSSFTGSPRYMIENYQDAMAIYRWAGYPNLFITCTCNAKWAEIELFLSRKPGQKIEDRPDVVARVFKILDKLLNNLKHVVYTIEYQKRGQPHAHILLFLHNDVKHPIAVEIDRIISAETPDLNKEPLAYDAVKQYMVHGPCGSINSRASCMIENKCVKHFPKKFCSQTTVDNDGFPIYRRRKNGIYVERNGVKLDNRYIVPHNIDLLVKLQPHINVEWCNHLRSIKYLFKYITKGPDRATLILEENLYVGASTGMQNMIDTDEVKGYLNCRYVSAIEPVVFKDTEYLDYVIDRPDIRKSKFIEWMKANELYEEERELTYSEPPTKWNYALSDIEQILIRSGRSLQEFETMPYPNTLLLGQCNNRILQEELDYDRDSLVVEHIELFNGLNFDQRYIYDAVIDSVLRNKEGKIVIAIASSRIAALLLPGGRTTHSRFQIPIIVTNNSTCGIKQGSQIAELMTKASLIIWDEAPMTHQKCFESVDRSLRDILHFTASNNADKPFGGKTVVLGGDFRQILPVIAKGRREQILEASINNSSLWNNCRVFILTKNMRLTENLSDIAAREFAEWILKIGDGELNNSESEALIEIPRLTNSTG